MKTALSFLFAMIIALSAPVSGPSLGLPRDAGIAFAADAPGSAAMVSNIIGAATVGRGGRAVPLKKGMLLAANDKLTLGPKSAVNIQFTDGSVTTLFEGTDVVLGTSKIRKDGSLEATMDVVKGKVRFFVKPKSVPNAVRFKTSNAVMGVRGTSGVIVVERGRSELFVSTGRVDVRSSSMVGAVPVPVTAGFATAVLRSAAPTPPSRFDASTLARDPFAGGGPATDLAPGAGERAGSAPEGDSEGGKGGGRPDANEPGSQEGNGPNGIGPNGNGPGEGTPGEAPVPSEPQERGATEGAGAEAKDEAAADVPGSPRVEGPSLETAPAPKTKAIFMPDGGQGIVVVGGNVNAALPIPAMQKVPLRDAQQAVRATTENAGKAVEQITRDVAQRAQSAAPAPRRKIPVEVQVEGW